jgi:CheY-like chemotaxis protein
MPAATILLAEDEPAIRSSSSCLTAEGYLVLPAKNGYEALTIFKDAQRDRSG